MVKILYVVIDIHSETDLDGVITYSNEDFGIAAEYPHELMIGHEHSLIRSLDMPDEVFKDMWETITTDKKWKGIVKNQTVNGTGCYWVRAIIQPLFEDGEKVGYVSHTTQTTPSEIERTIRTYDIEYD